MAIEYLSSAADFAHLDGALVYPLIVDGYHVLVVADGAILVLPKGMDTVPFPGKFGVADGAAHVDREVDAEEALALEAWGRGLQDVEVLDHIRAHIAQVVAASPDPEQYLNSSREEI